MNFSSHTTSPKPYPISSQINNIDNINFVTPFTHLTPLSLISHNHYLSVEERIIIACLL